MGDDFLLSLGSPDAAEEETALQASEPQPVDIPSSRKLSEEQDETTMRISIEESIERLGMGSFQYRIFVVSGLCFAADAMEVLLLSFLSIVLRSEWNLTTHQTALLTSSVFVGALVGTLTFGLLGDRIGRRPTFLLSAVIIGVFGLLSAFSLEYYSLLITRAIVGAGIGGLTIPFDTMAEFLPAAHRGTKLLAIQGFWTIGNLLVVLAAWVSLQLFDENWRLFVAICAVPCWISALVGLMFVPESPRWLVSSGRQERALDILRGAARKNGLDPTVVFPEGIQIVTGDVAGESSSVGFVDLVTTKHWRSLIFWLSLVWAGMGFLYYSNILLITLVFASDTTFDYRAILYSVVAELFGVAMVIFTVDWWGRVPSQVFAYLVAGICVGLLSLGDGMGFASRNTLKALAFGSRWFFMSASSVTWTSTPELLPTEIRTTGHSMVNAVARVTGAVSPFVVQSNLTEVVVGVILTSVSIVAAFSSWMLPESKGIEMGTAAKKPRSPFVGLKPNTAGSVV